MLALLVVQILAALGLGATGVGFVIGPVQRRFPREPVRVVAKRPPAPGTQALWVGGTLLAVLWPVGVFLAPLYAYHWPALPDFPGSWVVQAVGVVLGASGGVLFFRSARAMGRQMTPAIQVQEGHRLLQDGPYRYVRHPVYTAILAVALGQTLLYLSLPLAVVSGMLVALALYRSRQEESLLRSPEGFGAAYDAYARRTGRFLPRLRSAR